MKYFTALADAAYARTAFAAAGLDFEKLSAAKDTDAIKTALAAKPSPEAEGESVKALAAAESKAKAANDLAESLKANLDSLEKEHEALGNSIKAIGLNPEDSAEKIEAAHKAAVAKSAREMVAKAGHPGVLDDPLLDPLSKKEEKPKDDVKGQDRMARDFNRQIAAFNAAGKSRN